MDWRSFFAYVTGKVDEELLFRNEYLAVENRILRARIKGRLALANPERPRGDRPYRDAGYDPRLVWGTTGSQAQ